MEREFLLATLREEPNSFSHELHVCGFGQVAAAARAMQLISQRRPHRVVLVGIAGRLTTELSVGEAYDFTSVTCDGIGVGSGATFCSAAQLGWAQFSSPAPRSTEITDRIDHLRVGDKHHSRELLSVCAASADPMEADGRRRRFPNALAEDMEGFGVAVACLLANIELQIIRGISNDVGNRDHRQWRVKAALKQAASLLKKSLT